MKHLQTIFFSQIAQLLLVIPLTLLLFVSVADAGGDLVLSKDGSPHALIVIPESATAVEKTAARELAEHLNQIVCSATSEKMFEVVPYSATLPSSTSAGVPLILIGNTPLSPKQPTADRPFKFDEILIRAEKGNLILTGHERRGCLYAVYSFLQDCLGVRWWAPKDTFIPSKPTVTVSDSLNISYAPAMISREMYHRDAQPTVFSARMKGNGFVTEEYGGAVRIINFVHSFYKYLPPAEYFDQHPEWYSEINGVRKHDRAQLCLTNEAMTGELIRKVLQTLRNNPGAKMIDVSQNDWYGYCTCEHCNAVAQHEGSQAGPLVLLLNKVAEAVEKEFPDVLVESLAYQYTRTPPKHIRPRDNVLIRLCTIECSYIQPLTGPQNEKFAEDMAGWSKIAKHLFIWDYVTNYNDYLGPHPNLRVLVPNVRYFVENGAIGLFEEGEGDDFVELRNWILMRVMWDPSLDYDVLFDEFTKGYYGEAVAPLIRQYWDVLIAQAEAEKIYLGCFGMNSAKWLDLRTLNRVTELMNESVKTATDVYGADSDELRRLRKSKMAIDHVWLSRYYPLRCEAREQNLPFLGPEDPIAAAEEFARLGKLYGTKSHVISQEKNFQVYLEGLRSGFLVQQNPPELCKDLPIDAWIAFDALTFNNYNNAAEIVEDKGGWNGKSVKMGTKVDWNTSFTPPVRGRYRVFASLRYEGTLKSGRIGSWGVYVPQEKKGERSQILTAEQFLTEQPTAEQPTVGQSIAGQSTVEQPTAGQSISGAGSAAQSNSVPEVSVDPGFRWIDFGSVEFRPSAYVWFAHGHNPQVDAIYVDRVILVDDAYADKVKTEPVK